ncbi:hypothetical protein SY89_02715 [Halolamina pelagica]|uniref:DUF4352 domain-containing protein n=1 Tax=Halolamina pelagica TaxID=699431 RepID=A0A0P7HXW3_9EURY|nr:FxLYD domain-containing protein [Halolamina pelagica]KPN31958.1 hypothetical protein SY89_02715 [Halolamina pelagica]
MERRKYLLSAGTVAVSAVAGCLGGGSVEPTFEIIADPPTQVQVTDITAEPDSSELTGEGLVVSGTLENTGDVDIRVPRIDAVFYGEEDVRLDDSYNFGETSETIAPGEKVRFEVVYLGDPSEVSRYTLAFSDSTPGYSTTSTPTDTETPTPTPEPVEESFSDGFETVEIDSSPDWTLDLRDKRATSQLEADARIVAESAPTAETTLSRFRPPMEVIR